jgi:hypothetical protein
MVCGVSEVTWCNGTSVFISIIAQAAFFNYWSGDHKSWQLVWHSSVPTVSWPLPHLHLGQHIFILPSSRAMNSNKQNPNSCIYVTDILVQLTAHANHNVFLNLFPSAETKFFNVSLAVVEMRVVFWDFTPCSVCRVNCFRHIRWR